MAVSSGLVVGARLQSSNAVALSSSSSSSYVPSLISYSGLRKNVVSASSKLARELGVLAGSSKRILVKGNRRLRVEAASGNGTPQPFEYDVVIISAGVDGHGAALHAVEEGLKTAFVEGDVVEGTCVNRGCVPSKALLAVSGRMREHRDEHHLKALGIQVESANYDRQAVADNANNLATKIRSILTNSMKGLGVDILTGFGSIVAAQVVKYGRIGFADKAITARNIIIATGSVPFVPPGIEIDAGVDPRLDAIVGSGYIGLEFSDVYTALGSEVTLIEALDCLMPGFCFGAWPRVVKRSVLETMLPLTSNIVSQITPAKDGRLVQIELVDTDERAEGHFRALIATGRAPFTKGLGFEKVNVVTQRGFVPVDERMQVVDAEGKKVSSSLFATINGTERRARIFIGNFSTATIREILKQGWSLSLEKGFQAIKGCPFKRAS